MAVAKAKIAARAEERYAREKADYEQKMARRAATEQDTGKKPVAVISGFIDDELRAQAAGAGVRELIST